MAQDLDLRATARLERGTVQVDSGSRNIAIVHLQGEHDLSTGPALKSALEHAMKRSNVLVDLSHCNFLDSTVITSLRMAAHSAQALGKRLAVVIPHEQPHAARLAEITRMAELLPVYSSRIAAHAALMQSPRLP